MRRVIAAVIVVGLAVGVVLLWPRSTADDPPGAEASTTITTALTTTTALGTTTSTIDDSHVVETVEEAEEILRELWFGWFEGIYNQDEERIREVVANPDLISSAVSQFGVMEFDQQPTSDSILISEVELLRSDSGCLGVWAVASGEFRQGSIEGVHVFRWDSATWLLINTWPLRDDLWEADCDVVLRS